MNRILHIFNTLSVSEKKKFSILLFLYCIASISDLIGVISIFPFLAVLSDNTIIYNNYYINILYTYFNFKVENFLILLGLISLFILILNQLLRVLSNWYLNYFFEKYYYKIASNTYSKLLNKDYIFHLKSNTTVNSQKILIQIGNVVTGYLSPLLLIIVNCITTLFIISFLLIYNYQLTIAVIILYFFYYTLIIVLFKKRLNEYGQTIPNYFSNASKIVTDSFNGIKEIKLMNKTNFFENQFKPILINYNLARVKTFLFQSIPHSLLEVFTFAILLVIVFYFYSPKNLSIIIPTLGILALALKRLQPTVTNIYNSLVQIRIYYPTFNEIYKEIFEQNHDEINFKENISFDNLKTLELKNINFKYTKTQENILSNINFKIDKGDKIGIFGDSGSGKSTFVDVVIGLLKPEAGNVILNNDILENYQSCIKSSIGYASHNGFIFDGTFFENITLEKNNNLSNFTSKIKKINDILELVCLDKFLITNLNNNINTKIGENGIKMSTGQNQRLVLARMLYTNPSFIILDEATNAMDKQIETKVLNNLFNKFNDKTILLISHDLELINRCSKIYQFKKGKIFNIN